MWQVFFRSVGIPVEVLMDVYTKEVCLVNFLSKKTINIVADFIVVIIVRV